MICRLCCYIFREWLFILQWRNFFLSSCLSPQHWSWGASGSSDLPVCGHQRGNHHPHQHSGQSYGCPRRHVQGFVRTPLQLDSEPHQLPAAAWHEYLVRKFSDNKHQWHSLFLSFLFLWLKPLSFCKALLTFMKVCAGRYKPAGENINGRAKREQKYDSINFWYLVACWENNVAMIKKTSEKPQSAVHWSKKSSFINMDTDCPLWDIQKPGFQLCIPLIMAVFLLPLITR